MVSLCQFLLVAIGAWVALRLHYATSIPFPLLLLIAGVITGLIGTLIGLPALRLSGLYLALITLMAAGRSPSPKIAQFPNGGDGFFGNSRGGGATSRPDATVHRDGRHRVLPVLRRRRRTHVPPRGVARPRQGRAAHGRPSARARPPPSPRGQHGAVQAVGVHAGIVHGRCGGRAPVRLGWRREHQPVPGRQLDHPARGRPHGRGLQPLRRGRSPRCCSGSCPGYSRTGGAGPGQCSRSSSALASSRS